MATKIDIESLTDEEKSQLITDLQASLKKSKKAAKTKATVPTATVKSKGQGCMGVSASERIAQLRGQ